jgi:hypothetical protein
MLNNDLIITIFDMCDWETKERFKDIIPEYYNNIIKNIIILQIFVTKYKLLSEPERDLIEADCWNNYRKGFFEMITKKTLLRYYTRQYPLEYLLTYPKFIVKKCGLNIEIDENKEYTKRGALEFLMDPRISVENICYAGW